MCRLLVCGVQRREYIWLDSDTHGPRDLLSGVRQLTRLVCRCVREGLTNVITFLPFDLNRVCLVITNQQHAYKISLPNAMMMMTHEQAAFSFAVMQVWPAHAAHDSRVVSDWLSVCSFTYLFIILFFWLSHVHRFLLITILITVMRPFEIFVIFFNIYLDQIHLVGQFFSRPVVFVIKSKQVQPTSMP